MLPWLPRLSGYIKHSPVDFPWSAYANRYQIPDCFTKENLLTFKGNLKVKMN
jgi:hypothetical protein